MSHEKNISSCQIYGTRFVDGYVPRRFLFVSVRTSVEEVDLEVGRTRTNGSNQICKNFLQNAIYFITCKENKASFQSANQHRRKISIFHCEFP